MRVRQLGWGRKESPSRWFLGEFPAGQWGLHSKGSLEILHASLRFRLAPLRGKEAGMVLHRSLQH